MITKMGDTEDTKFPGAEEDEYIGMVVDFWADYVSELSKNGYLGATQKSADWLRNHDNEVIEECALLMEERPVMATEYYAKRIRALKDN